MALIDLIDKDVIKVPLEATGKVDVIKELVGILDSADRIRERERIEDALLERENQGSTGLENGIAVPHAKTEAVAASQEAPLKDGQSAGKAGTK